MTSFSQDLMNSTWKLQTCISQFVVHLQPQDWNFCVTGLWVDIFTLKVYKGGPWMPVRGGWHFITSQAYWIGEWHEEKLQPIGSIKVVRGSDIALEIWWNMNNADKEEEMRGFASSPLLGHPDTLEIWRILKTDLMMMKPRSHGVLLVPLCWDTLALTYLKSDESSSNIKAVKDQVKVNHLKFQ